MIFKKRVEYNNIHYETAYNSKLNKYLNLCMKIKLSPLTQYCFIELWMCDVLKFYLNIGCHVCRIFNNNGMFFWRSFLRNIDNSNNEINSIFCCIMKNKSYYVHTYIFFRTDLF